MKNMKAVLVFLCAIVLAMAGFGVPSAKADVAKTQDLVDLYASYASIDMTVNGAFIANGYEFKDNDLLSFTINFNFKSSTDEDLMYKIREEYKKGTIDTETEFTIPFTGAQYLDFDTDSGSSYAPLTEADARLATDQGTGIFYWWLDAATNTVRLKFTEDALKESNITINQMFVKVQGLLDRDATGSQEEIAFTAGNTTFTADLAQEYTLAKTGRLVYDPLSSGYAPYKAEYTITISLLQDQNLTTDPLVITDTKGSAIGTIRNYELVGSSSGTDDVTASLGGIQSGQRGYTFTLQSRDNILKAGTYTFTYQTSVNAYDQSFNNSSVADRTNTATMEGLTASSTVAYEPWSDRVSVTKSTPVPWNSAVYEEGGKYYADYVVTVTLEDDVTKFVLHDWIPNDYKEYLQHIDDNKLDVKYSADGSTFTDVPAGVKYSAPIDSDDNDCKFTVERDGYNNVVPAGTYRFSYRMLVTEAAIEKAMTSGSFDVVNKLSEITVDNNKIEFGNPPTVTYTVPTYSENSYKNGTYVTAADGTTLIKWEVSFEYALAENGATLTDTLTNAEYYITGDYPFTITQNWQQTQILKLTSKTSGNGLDFGGTEGNESFVYTLGSNANEDVGSRYWITYYTVAPENSTATSMSNNVGVDYNNDGKNDWTAGVTDQPWEVAKEGDLTKSGTVLDADRATGDAEIKWTLTFDLKEVPYAELTTLILTDELGAVHTLAADPAPIVVLTDNNWTKHTLEANTHYTVEHNTSGLVLTFDTAKLRETATTCRNIAVTFVTNSTDDEATLNSQDGSHTYSYTNNAHVNYEYGSYELSDSAEKTVEYKYTFNKTGSLGWDDYNATTGVYKSQDGIIDYAYYVTLTDPAFKNPAASVHVKVTDVLPSITENGKTFPVFELMPETVKITNGIHYYYQSITSANITSTSTGFVLEFDVPTDWKEETVTVMYCCRVADEYWQNVVGFREYQYGTLINSVTAEWDGATDDDSCSDYAKFEDDRLDKSAKVNDYDITYTIEINPHGYDLDANSSTLTLTDRFSAGADKVSYNRASFVLKSGDKVLTAGEDYTLTFADDGSYFTIVIPDGTPLTLTYDVLVTTTVSSGQNSVEIPTLSNTVSLNGVTEEHTLNNVDVREATEGVNTGLAAGNRGVKINKYDTDGALLANAVFTVYTVSEDGVLTEYTIDTDSYMWYSASSVKTDAIGLAMVQIDGDDIAENVFAIKETQAPDGYVVSTNVHYFYFTPYDENGQPTALSATQQAKINKLRNEEFKVTEITGDAGEFTVYNEKAPYTPISDTLPLTKNLYVLGVPDNTPPEKMNFTFEMVATQILPTDTTIAAEKCYVINTATSEVSFENFTNGSHSKTVEEAFKVTFMQPGTYTFKVSEKSGDVGFVTYDSTEYEVTYTVVGNNGALSVTKAIESEQVKVNNGISFVNTYAVKSITVNKVWDDCDNAFKTRPESITLQLWIQGDNEEPHATQTVYPDTNGNWSLNWVNLLGNVEYEVVEVVPDNYSATYSSVTAGAHTTTTITNKLPTAEDDLGLVKALNGYNELGEKEAFQFVMEFDSAVDENNAEKTTGFAIADREETLYIAETGKNYVRNKAFHVTFTEPGTYTFNVREAEGESGYVTYDSTVYTVVYTVTKNDAGVLEAARTIKDANDQVQSGSQVKFTNTIDLRAAAEVLPIFKQLNSQNESVPAEGLTFDFTLTNTPATESDGYTITGADAETGVAKESLTFTSCGGQQNAFIIEFTKLGTYTFEVKETTESTNYLKADSTVYTVTYEVEMPATSGELAVTRTIKVGETEKQKVEFTNEYGAINISGKKVWQDADDTYRLKIDAGTFKDDYLKLYKVKTVNGVETLTEITAEQLKKWGATLSVSYYEGGVTIDGASCDNFEWYYYDLPAFDDDGSEILYAVKELTVNGYQTFYVNHESGTFAAKTDGIYAGYPHPAQTNNTIYNNLAKGELEITKTVKVEGNVSPGTLPEFQFTITPADDSTTGYHFVDADGNAITSPVTVTVDPDTYTGKLPVYVLFDDFTGTPDANGDVKKNYSFLVKEVVPQTVPEGWTYSTAEYDVEFTVTRNGSNGVPMVNVESRSTDCGFKNTYEKFEAEGSFAICKDVITDDTLPNVTFDFTITPGENNPGGYTLSATDQALEIPVAEPLTLNDKGVFELTLKAAQSKSITVTFTKPGSYTFEVKESLPDPIPNGWVYDEHTHFVYFTVKDDGTCDFEYSGGNNFNNCYDVMDLTITKMWQGDDPATRPVKLEDFSELLTLRYAYDVITEGTGAESQEPEWYVYDKVEPVVTEETGEWLVTWKALPGTINGTTVKWSVVEEPIAGYITDYDYTDVDDKGELWATFNITNKLETKDVSVTKMWVDGPYDGSETKVDLVLYANSVPVDAEPIQVENEYTWYDLPKYTGNDLIVYTVREINVPAGYQVEYWPIYGEDGEVIGKDYATHGETITNSYFTAGTTIELVKYLDGEPSKEEFTFILQETDEAGNVLENGTYAVVGNAVKDSSNDKAGDIEFVLTYEGADLGKTFYYQVTEQNDGGDYIYDDTVHRFKVTISDTGSVTWYGWVGNMYGEYMSTVFQNWSLTEVGISKWWFDDTITDETEVPVLTGEDLILYRLRNGELIYEVDAKPVLENTYSHDTGIWVSEYKWTGLPKYDEFGDEIVYAVTEEFMPGYTTIYYDQNGEQIENGSYTLDGGCIDNYRKMVAVSVLKDWVGGPYNGSETKVDLVLYADGVLLDAKPSQEGYWYNWYDLPQYDDAGKHIVYTVKEINVPAGYTVTYTAVGASEDDANAEIIDTGDSAQNGGIITNTYKAEGSVTLKGTKTMVGRELKDGEFEFELYRVLGSSELIVGSNETLIEKVSNKDGQIAFSEIKYTEDDAGKTYTYKVYEVKGEQEGVNYVEEPVTVKVAVIDNGDGTLTAKLTEDSPAISFINTYTADGEVLFSGTKTMNGKALNGNDFTFVLTDDAGKEIEIVTNDKSGNIVFTAIKYDLDDAGETYTYKVYEKNDGQQGVTYDATVYTVTVKVEDAGNGTLKVTVSDDAAKLNFINTYTADGEVLFSGTKTMNGKALTGNDFTFVLTDDAGKEIETVKNTETGAFAFTAIKYDLDDAGETYTYKVYEKNDGQQGVTYDATVYTVTVKVEDAGNGTLKVTASDDAAKLNFINTYTADGEVLFTGTKTMNGKALNGNDFTFVLTDDAGKEIETVKNTETGAFAFTAIKYDLDDAGKTYTYKVYEKNDGQQGVTYDATVYTVTVKVEDAGNGTLKVTASDDAAKLNFTNTYKAEGSVTLKGTKTMNGKALNGNDFTFVLTDDAGKEIETVKNTETGAFAFTAIKYDLDDAGKTYTYKVYEKNDGQSGVTYDATVYTVTVKVEDAGNGTLKVTASDDAAKLNFTNTYTADGEVLFTGTKTMNGKDLTGNDFTFVLTDDAGKEIEIVTNDKSGNIVFTAIKYDLDDAGETYTYKVYEKNDGQSGVTYDATVHTVTVKVEDAGNGTLKATASANAMKLNFTNSYEAKATITMNAYKTVNGYAPTDEQVYDFVLLGDGVELKAQNKNENITFGNLTFDQDDVGKTFIYTVKETTEGSELLSVDTTLYEVAVTVLDNGDGTLKLETEILKDGKRASGVLFTNTATATLSITKTVKGPGPDKAFDLKVTFTGVDGKEIEGTYSYSGDVSGTITSGGVIALKDGQSVTIVGLPEGAAYTVEENAGPAYTVTVNGQAISKAEGTLKGHSKLEFINTVEVTTFSVTKVWEGLELGDIILTLYADGKVMEPQPEVTREGDKYTCYELPKYNEAGEEIVYSAKEKGIEGYIRIYNNVEPFGNVTSFIHDSGTIINREVDEEVHELSFKIKKTWTGLEEGETAPAITLTLMCNGEKVDVATPKPDSEGWYRYYDLPKTVNGAIAVYTVEEAAITGYTVTYKDASGEIVETGVNGGEIINAKIPQTNDTAALGLWLTMLGASAALLLTMFQRRRKA